MKRQTIISTLQKLKVNVLKTVRMTKEQQESINDMKEKSFVVFCAEESLLFLEKELGKVHAVTIKYRKTILKQKIEELSKYQYICFKNGSIDKLVKDI